MENIVHSYVKKHLERVETEIEDIPVNIWDDYYEDGYVPEGKVQETYIYIENSDLSHEFRKECLDNLLPHIRENVGPEVRLFENFYDSKKKYPNVTGPEHEHFHFGRWEIRVENMSHKVRHELLEKLQSLDLKYKNIPYHIYSES